MEKKLKITSDSTADLDFLYKERGIDVLPLVVTLGTKSGYDSIDITPETIFQYYKETKKTPKTAALSPEDYYKFFKERTDKGYELIHFTISSKMSSCYENACKAATECGGVRVVNSMALSTGIGLQVLYADDLAKKGYTSAEIYNKVIERQSDINTSFVVDTLEFLAKGGRCSGAAAFFAGILKLKPEIVVRDGEMVVGKKYMGKNSVVIEKYVSETISKYPNMDPKYVFITHTADPEITQTTKEYLEKQIPGANIIITHAGSTITAHCGKGTLGVLFYKNKIDD